MRDQNADLVALQEKLSNALAGEREALETALVAANESNLMREKMAEARREARAANAEVERLEAALDGTNKLLADAWVGLTKTKTALTESERVRGLLREALELAMKWVPTSTRTLDALVSGALAADAALRKGAPVTTLNDPPTHRCKVCGALWWCGVIDNGVERFPSWSLRSPSCGPCCDNVAMGTQIEPLPRGGG